MTKTYAINGIVEASYLFKAGQGSVRAEFTGGVIDERRFRPATMTTKNNIAMLVIENSDMFKNGTIFIAAQSEDAKPMAIAENAQKDKTEKKKNPKADKVKDDGRKVFESVNSLGDAVNVLLDLGVKAAALQDMASILQVAGEMNISFPNLKLK